MQGLIGPLYGPNGQDGLIVTATNDILVTSSGAAILQAIRSSADPLERLMVDRALEFAKIYGDGSKGLVLMMCALRAQVRDLTPLPLQNA
jgi:chaperonin GroEL (HSP60 family)